MPTFPDLPTDSISYVAYWNAIDQGGVSAIDPEEVTSQTNVTASTLYDNGVELEYTLTTGRTATVRVKSDGWFVAYIDRTERFNFPVNEGDYIDVIGPWDIDNNWADISEFNPSTGGNLTNNTLERAINSLQAELSNSGSINYDVPDVGLYNYEYPNATNSTAFGNSVDQSSATNGFLYTGGTTLYWAITCGAADYQNPSHTIVTTTDGTVLIDPSQNGSGYFTYDLLANNAIPNSETEYTTNMNYNEVDNFAGGPSGGRHTVLIAWS